MQSLPYKHKAGFVTIIGKPNVGKSTLMNVLLAEKLSIITPKAQTTRHSILGILNHDQYQIIYTDTPGILTPAYALQEAMMQTVYNTLRNTDLILWVIDIHEQDIDQVIQQNVLDTTIPTLLLINKIDLANTKELTKILQYWQKKVNVQDIIPLAALHPFDPKPIVERILKYLPEHPPYYPKDLLTDRPERFFVAELIREQLLRNYKKEIPYSVEVVIEAFQETDALIRIRAIIYVERKTQKAILIGHRGINLKQVGIAARKSLEHFLGKQVYLEQHVKTLANWRQKIKLLKQFGYQIKI
jgi:GTP-binding protein Era